MKLKLAGAAAVVSLLLNPGSGAFAGSTVDGSGGKTCGTWLEDEKPESGAARHAVDLQWVLGFLSATNLGVKVEILKDTDANAVAAWIDNYCTAHPLDGIDDATMALSAELIYRAKAKP